MPKLTTIKGPSIHLVQYLRDTPPYNTLEGLAAWAGSLGYKALQVPVDARLIDIHRAAEDQAYCDSIKATVAKHGVEISELSTHLAGQLIAVHPAYDVLFDGFAPPQYRGDSAAREKWARSVLFDSAKASKRLWVRMCGAKARRRETRKPTIVSTMPSEVATQTVSKVPFDTPRRTKLRWLQFL